MKGKFGGKGGGKGAFGGKGAAWGAAPAWGGLAAADPWGGYEGYGAKGFGAPAYGGAFGGAFGARAAGYGTGLGGLAGAPAGAAKPKPAAVAAGPPVTWITLTEESTITNEGLPAEAPVVVFEKGVSVFGEGSYILCDFLPNMDEEVEFIDDPDWKQFPEIASALRETGLEENCNCVAFAKAQGKWAVGCAPGHKPRQNAAKLALSVALAVENPSVDVVCRGHPDFRAMLLKAEIIDATVGLGPAPVVGKKAKAAAGSDDSHPDVHWIVLNEESTLTGQGLPAEGAAVAYNKAQSIFSSSHHILSCLVEDVAVDCEFVHDPDWKQFPEVARAMKAAAPVEAQSFVLATCPGSAKWALGLASGWKHRESAGKLALAVAIAQDGGPFVDEAFANYPEFAALVSSGAFDPEAAAAAAAEPPGLGLNAGMPPAKRQKVAAGNPLLGLGESGLNQAMLLPKDSPLWLRLETPPAILIDGMPTETLLLNAEETGQRKKLFPSVDEILSLFVENVAAEIEVVDDPSWEQFPEITAALSSEYAPKDECLHVALCGSLGMWAAGTGRKWKTRNCAAKVALATVLALRAAEQGEAPDLSEYPDFSAFLEEAALLS